MTEHAAGWPFRERMQELAKHREFMKNLISWYDVGCRVCYKQEENFVVVNELVGPSSSPYPGEQLAAMEFWDEDSAKDFIKWIELTIRFHGDVR